MSQIWKYKEADVQNLSPELIESVGGFPVLAKLMAIRGIADPVEAKAFLNIQDYQPSSSDVFPDMPKALHRIRQAIDTQEAILVYGDFDVDGITGTSVLYETLKSLNAKVSYYIPSRHSEGHGLNTASLCRLVSSRQLKLVISTDTGITNFNEVNLLKGLNVDTIITDHHELPENLPQAFAILNPKLLSSQSPVFHMAGVGVAYKLCEAILQAYDAPQSQIEALLDLVAVGTVVDMVPLLGENRYLVWRGLQVLQKRERLGLHELLLAANVNESAPITTTSLGFSIGPRLNAIGRIAHAHEAVELLTTADQETAKQLAAKLEHYNRRRKEMVDECLLKADTHLINTGELTDQKAIILCSPDWNQGIVGLVATRLIEKYHRPCFIGYIDDDSQEIRFSARSIEGFNLHQHLTSIEDLFIKWGGHSGAAGFSITQKDLPKLKSRLFQLCQANIPDELMAPVTWIDMTLAPSQVNPYLLEMIERMAPFGQSNPLPIFAMEKVSIGAQRFLGEDQRHLKLVLSGADPGQYLEAIHWNWGQDRPKLDPKQTYRFAFTVELNTYNGNEKIQLLLKDCQDESKPNVSVLRAHPANEVVLPQPPNPAKIAPEVMPVETPSETKMAAEQWVDHRRRDEIDSFLNEVLLPAKDPDVKLATRIYCEGTQPFLPTPIPKSLFCTRQDVQFDVEIQRLILWDLPPDMEGLTQLLQRTSPQWVHLIGGKYQKIPIYRSTQEVLEGMFKVIQKLGRTQSSETSVVEVELSHLSGLLALTPDVILSGITLLGRMEALQASLSPDSDALKITLLSPPRHMDAGFESLLEFRVFKNALQDVYQFREWLMTAPIHLIQSSVNLELSSGKSLFKQERESHVINLH